jgi:hypothetical protein
MPNRVLLRPSAFFLAHRLIARDVICRCLSKHLPEVWQQMFDVIASILLLLALQLASLSSSHCFAVILKSLGLLIFFIPPVPSSSLVLRPRLSRSVTTRALL